MLEYCRQKSLDPHILQKAEYFDAVLKKYGFKEWDAIRAAVGHGGLKEGQIVNKLLELYEKDHPTILTNEEVLKSLENTPQVKPAYKSGKTGIVVKGLDDVAVRFSKCCSPIPGDEIVGFITRGRGVSIHRTDCVNILHLPEVDRNRLIEAEWQIDVVESSKYLAEINIYCENRQGVLSGITRILSEKNISILSLNARVSKQGTATVSVSFEVSSKEELKRVIDKLGEIKEIIDIERTTG